MVELEKNTGKGEQYFEWEKNINLEYVSDSCWLCSFIILLGFFLSLTNSWLWYNVYEVTYMKTMGKKGITYTFPFHGYHSDHHHDCAVHTSVNYSHTLLFPCKSTSLKKHSILVIFSWQYKRRWSTSLKSHKTV